jgi:hypothetical protein
VPAFRNTVIREATKMQRTDDDIILRAPIKIKLGDTAYPIQVLRLGKAREWRQKLLGEMAQVLASFGEAPTPDNMAPALTAAMLSFPDRLLDLVLAYAPELDKTKLEDEATDEQLAVAYGKITAVAFPFVAQLEMTARILKKSR